MSTTATLPQAERLPRWALCASCYYMPEAAQRTFARFFVIPTRPGTGRALRIRVRCDAHLPRAIEELGPVVVMRVPRTVRS